MDPNRPLCKKAKLLRQERRESKLAKSTLSLASLENKKTVPLAKSLEDYLNEALPDSPAHRLQVSTLNIYYLLAQERKLFIFIFQVCNTYLKNNEVYI